jgi:hypothetical protein
MRAHLEKSHDLSSIEQVIEHLERAKTLGPIPFDTTLCPLCLQVPDGGTARSFISHVCRRLESIALDALPRRLAAGEEVGSEYARKAESNCEGAISLKISEGSDTTEGPERHGITFSVTSDPSPVFDFIVEDLEEKQKGFDGLVEKEAEEIGVSSDQHFTQRPFSVEHFILSDQLNPEIRVKNIAVANKFPNRKGVVITKERRGPLTEKQKADAMKNRREKSICKEHRKAREKVANSLPFFDKKKMLIHQSVIQKFAQIMLYISNPKPLRKNATGHQVMLVAQTSKYHTPSRPKNHSILNIPRSTYTRE